MLSNKNLLNIITRLPFSVAESTQKRLASSTHSLSHSPYIDRKVQEIILCELRPRGMSSIYHDSDENMVRHANGNR